MLESLKVKEYVNEYYPSKTIQWQSEPRLNIDVLSADFIGQLRLTNVSRVILDNNPSSQKYASKSIKIQVQVIQTPNSH
jgi:hypothetical protein